MKRKFIIIGVIILMVVLVMIGFYIFVKQRDRQNMLPSSSQQTQIPSTSSPESPAQPIQPVIPEIRDTDGDRLSDEDENRYRTDPTKPDTDGDGLSDWEEAIIYETDPLKTDTDGDNFSDSQEVRAGYDPRSKEPRQLP